MFEGCGIILAGGKSSRMGQDKSLLKIGNQLVIEHTVQLLRSLFSRVIIISNAPDKFALPDVDEFSDVYVGRGPLGGIHAGLLASEFQRNFVIACDSPFVEQPLIEYIWRQSEGFQVTLPKIEDKLQPLFAVYDSSVLEPVVAFLEAGHGKISELYSTLQVNYLSEKQLAAYADLERVFFNMNTPADFEQVRRQLEREG